MPARYDSLVRSVALSIDIGARGGGDCYAPRSGGLSKRLCRVRYEPALEVDGPPSLIHEPEAEVLGEICFSAKHARLSELRHGRSPHLPGQLHTGSIAPDRSETADEMVLFCGAGEGAGCCLRYVRAARARPVTVLGT
jgi:hypothetical protein